MNGQKPLVMLSGGGSPEAAIAHTDLAAAYLEIGLLPDALVESAVAIADRAPAPHFARAVRVMLDPELAGPGVLRRLRTVLYRRLN